jgi:hypothetical protein
MKKIKHPKPPGLEAVPAPPMNRVGSIPSHLRDSDTQAHMLEQERERLLREKKRLEMRTRRVDERLRQIDDKLSATGSSAATYAGGGGAPKNWAVKKLKY